MCVVGKTLCVCYASSVGLTMATHILRLVGSFAASRSGVRQTFVSSLSYPLFFGVLRYLVVLAFA
jgi:hypothetical protein